jgi:hypothetical protein
MVPILWQINPIHTIPSYLSKIEISSATVLSEPALYRLQTFHVPNLISILFRLGRLSKESVQVRGFFRIFVTPKLEDNPLSAVRDCLFNIFAASLQKINTIIYINVITAYTT